ncbi:HsdM family class I SAM-dependent methyltransferase [Rhizobium sp. C4]|uniref:HsdM family class I SAM-dependent methyltransferase n=1 Tax=Rhizobium sp. C4 TaxID=1349800 RepID=UPI001E46C793|nr:N-6 DNA methylase [Rhizobium sp. C4]MCD2173985.1 SAM-dependent methyltransferase [Rhizobium sp. C4]
MSQFDDAIKKMRNIISRSVARTNTDLALALIVLATLVHRAQHNYPKWNHRTDVLHSAHELEIMLGWENKAFSEHLLGDLQWLDETSVSELLSSLPGENTEEELEAWLLRQLDSLEIPLSHETPEEVARLMVMLTRHDHCFNIFDPACGSGSLLVAASKTTIGPTCLEGYEANEYAAAWAQVRFALNETPNVRLHINKRSNNRGGKRRLVDEVHKFDTVLTNPPFGIQFELQDLQWLEGTPALLKHDRGKISSELAYLLSAYHHLKDQGMAAVLVPVGVLFRGGNDANIRQFLIKERALAAVIALPARLSAPNTAIETAILVLRRGTSGHDGDNVLMIDARELGKRIAQRVVLDTIELDKIIHIFQGLSSEKGFSKLTHADEIKKQEFSLLPQRYVEYDSVVKTDRVKRRFRIEELTTSIRTLIDTYESLRNKLD